MSEFKEYCVEIELSPKYERKLAFVMAISEEHAEKAFEAYVRAEFTKSKVYFK